MSNNNSLRLITIPESVTALKTRGYDLRGVLVSRCGRMGYGVGRRQTCSEMRRISALGTKT
jgi:hypothetical protein